MGTLIALATTALAHQPRIPQGNSIDVPDPEVSKAYYGQLDGRPHVYRIVSIKPFALYVNVLVPDLPGQVQDIIAVVIKDGNANQPVAVLDGREAPWHRFFEPFGHDRYWMGPAFRAQAGPGQYQIMVMSQHNDSKYALAVGEKESFDVKETVNALTLIPRIKRGWFNKSPADFILSPFGAGLALLMFALAFALGFLLRLVLRGSSSATACGAERNLGIIGRTIVALIGAGLFAWAIMTSWSPLLLFLSGFACFAASAGWRGLCAAFGIGKRSTDGA